ncbi:MAG: hydroxymethylbilane synthase [Sulfolobales archaeon]
MLLRIGTRGSSLAVKQTLEVVDAIKRVYSGVEFELVKIRTRGDAEGSPRRIAEPGIFTKEIDLELIRGNIDLAVHSLKDYPTKIPEGLEITAIPRRASRRDAIIPGSYRSLREIPSGSIIGTSSMRRISHILYHRRDLRVRRIRGNVDTRIRKVGVDVDIAILAEAGLQRLGFEEYTPLDPSVITPQAGQGALAVVARTGSTASKIASLIDDPVSRLEASVERGFISLLGVGCRAPIGVTAIAVGSSVRVIASLVSPDYTHRIYIDRFYDSLKAGDIVEKVMREFEALGGLELVREWERVSSGQGDLDGD